MQLNVYNTNFTDYSRRNLNNTSIYEYPGGLYLEEITKLTIDSCHFSTLKGQNGGALSITLSQTLKT